MPITSGMGKVNLICVQNSFSFSRRKTEFMASAEVIMLSERSQTQGADQERELRKI